MTFPIRTWIKGIKKEWTEKAQMLEQVHQELTLQRTNCLTTIQQSNQEQVHLLEKTVETLGEIHLSQERMAGFMQAMNKR